MLAIYLNNLRNKLLFIFEETTEQGGALSQTY